MKRLFLLSLFVASCSVYLTGQVSLDFQVNMSYQVEMNKFNPNTDFVDVAGTFNDWGDDLTKLSDQDQDGIYDVTVNGFNPGEQIRFKFRINGAWNDREEFPFGGGDRVYTVQDDNNVISVWYNDQILPDAGLVAAFDANRHMLYQGGMIMFTNKSAGEPTEIRWYFEGSVLYP